MDPKTAAFKESAAKALTDETLRKAMAKAGPGFIDKRRKAAEALPEFEALRDASKDVREHALTHLDVYLEMFERNVVASGGHVHWARDAADARKIILGLCKDAGAKTVAKGKSMVSEEIGLNAHLIANDITPIETDLGEYIIQLRDEPPSHIIAPAVHVTKEQAADAFRAAHDQLPADRDLSEAASLLAEARMMLRRSFLNADVGITGANFLVAETGGAVIVTNEGNGDLTQSLPNTHIVVSSIEKICPTLDDLSVLLRVLGRSATGQEMTVYTTMSTGPKRAADMDGPEHFHVVLVDNGRSAMLADERREMLRCIRCGACMNHCPVYQAVGGHSYGWVYPGPMGAVLTPSFIGIHQSADLPSASTFCGRCESVCPVRIPLPDLMRGFREKAFANGHVSGIARWGLKAWAFAARRPALYRAAARLPIRVLGALGAKAGALRGCRWRAAGRRPETSPRLKAAHLWNSGAHQGDGHDRAGRDFCGLALRRRRRFECRGRPYGQIT